MSNHLITPQEAGIEFDEGWYLRRYPQIGALVRSGDITSGWEHYFHCGRSEGRQPIPPGSDGTAPPWVKHNGPGFLAPTDLSVSDTPLNRVAVIGSCTAEYWGFQHRNASNCPVDLIVLNNVARLSTQTRDEVMRYDFVIVELPLPAIIGHEGVWRFAYNDEAAYEQEFARTCDALEFRLNNFMQWNREFGLLTFVANFMAPQQNPMGRLFPRFSLTNPEYFVTRLNEHLEKIVRRNGNAYVLDLDRLSASLGRRYLQDDATTLISHNGLLVSGLADTSRMDPMLPLDQHYEIQPRSLPDVVWAELVAMYRTVRQIDPVKVVVVDLDDTMWNGISGDMEDFDGGMVAGWPIGLAEALVYLKKRGILLAIASKNDEARIRELWPRIFSNRLHLDDFAAVRINWRPKAENMREILAGMNLLPRNTVFIDDNPAEREAMRQAFPDMRILGRYPWYLRRILLWSSETQVAEVTGESGRRTEMMQAQFTRETNRAVMSDEQFLRDAAPKIRILPIEGSDHPRFGRVFELLNKTNQFNTTGRRWRIETFEEYFGNGGRMLAFEIDDRFTAYGLVGVVLFRSNHVEQWVMSCRVLGYQIEDAVMSIIVAKMREEQAGLVTGQLIHTDSNFPCRDLFRNCGFVEQSDAGHWVLAADTPIGIPGHITIT